MTLSTEDRATLLSVARQTLDATAQGLRPPEFQVESSALRSNRCAFVTLRLGHRLRGCIGCVEPVSPL